MRSARKCRIGSVIVCSIQTTRGGSALKKTWVLAVALASMTVLTAAPAGAAGGTTCTAPSGTLKSTPGIDATLTLQTISVSMPIKGCVGGGVTGGTLAGTVKVKESIATVSKTPVSMKLTIKWNTGKTSTFNAKITTKVVAGKFVSTVKGKITSGTVFVGKTVTTKATDTFKSVGGKVTSIGLKGTGKMTVA